MRWWLRVNSHHFIIPVTLLWWELFYQLPHIFCELCPDINIHTFIHPHGWENGSFRPLSLSLACHVYYKRDKIIYSQKEKWSRFAEVRDKEFFWVCYSASISGSSWAWDSISFLPGFYECLPPLTLTLTIF